MTFLGVACDDWGGPCDQIFCSYWSSFERHDDHMIWSGNGRYCVIDMVEFEVTDSLWLRNSHLKWYWEGILEYMWIIQYLRQLRLSDEWYWCNDRLRIGRTVDDICERIGILWSCGNFELDYRLILTILKLENLCRLSTWFVMILEAHNKMIIWHLIFGTGQLSTSVI